MLLLLRLLTKAFKDEEEIKVTAQSLLCPESYQSEADWNMYDSDGTDNTSVQSRLMTMAVRLHKIGLKKPTERTFGAAAAVACFRQGSSADALANTRQLKTFFGHCKHEAPLGPGTYPTDPASLRETHPLLWATLADAPGIKARAAGAFAGLFARAGGFA